MINLDELLDAAVLEAALAGGRDPKLAARQFGVSRVIAAGVARGDVPAPATAHGQANRWTPEEMAFLRANAGVLGDAEIGAALGRSEAAVRVQVRRKGLMTPVKHTDYLTAQAAARVLGVDVHAVCGWIDRGLLAAELAPVRERRIWRVRRTAFYAWALRPENWVYFIRSVWRPERIRDERLRRLLVKRKAVWGDEWWTTGEVAEFHGVESNDVQRYITAGKLPGVRYQNWMVLRSDATRPGLRFFSGAGAVGAAGFERGGTAAGDAFIVLAAAVGIPDAHISRMMGRGSSASSGGVWSRRGSIAKRGLTPWLVRAYGLPMETRPDGAVWADWRPLAHRFRALERAWGRLGRGERITRFDRRLLAGVLGAFMRFHQPEHPLTGKMHGNGVAKTAALVEARGIFEAFAGPPTAARSAASSQIRAGKIRQTT